MEVLQRPVFWWFLTVNEETETEIKRLRTNESVVTYHIVD